MIAHDELVALQCVVLWLHACGHGGRAEWGGDRRRKLLSSLSVLPWETISIQTHLCGASQDSELSCSVSQDVLESDVLLVVRRSSTATPASHVGISDLCGVHGSRWIALQGAAWAAFIVARSEERSVGENVVGFVAWTDNWLLVLPRELRRRACKDVVLLQEAVSSGKQAVGMNNQVRGVALDVGSNHIVNPHVRQTDARIVEAGGS